MHNYSENYPDLEYRQHHLELCRAERGLMELATPIFDNGIAVYSGAPARAARGLYSVSSPRRSCPMRRLTSSLSSPRLNR